MNKRFKKPDQCCVSESRSRRIGIILPDTGPHPEPADPELDPDPNTCHPNVKLNYTLEYFNILSKILKIMTSITLAES
jgi:hypothetical protein